MSNHQRSLLRAALKGVTNLAFTPFGYEIRKRQGPTPPVLPVEATEREKQLVEKYNPFTMTGRWRQWCLLKAIDYVDARQIPGAIVECGVWRAGNIMMAKEFRQGRLPRDYYLYDTFTGMPEPTEADVSYRGVPASTKYKEVKREGYTDWALSRLDEVKANLERFGLMESDIQIREGKVEDTLRNMPLPDQISVLRLDTDWYESTRVEMEILYPRLASGGVLIIDDYGDWLGSAKAVDEYFSADHKPCLMAIDRACRFAVKG